MAAVSVTPLFPIDGWAPSFIAAAFPTVCILSAARQLKGTPQFLMRPEAARARSEGRTGQAHELAREAGADLAEQPTPLATALRSHRWFPSGLSLLGTAPAPQRSFATIVAIYRPGLFVLIGLSAALLFFNAGASRCTPRDGRIYPQRLGANRRPDRRCRDHGLASLRHRVGSLGIHLGMRSDPAVRPSNPGGTERRPAGRPPRPTLAPSEKLTPRTPGAGPARALLYLLQQPRCLNSNAPP